MRIKAIVCVFVMFTLGVAYAAQAPVVMLRQTAVKVISELNKNKNDLKDNPKLINDIVKNILLPRVDELQMARAVVDRNVWRRATSQQKKQFVKEFRQLVVKTYAAAFSEYSNETVRFRPVPTRLLKYDTLQVQSEILRYGKPSIPIIYSLTKKRTGWQIYDFSVEGVSMVRSFRSQFASLSRQGMKPLIDRLAQHNEKRS